MLELFVPYRLTQGARAPWSVSSTALNIIRSFKISVFDLRFDEGFTF